MRLVKLATILAIPLLAAACAQQGGLGNGMGGGVSSGMGAARFARYMHQTPAMHATQQTISTNTYCREFEETILVDGKPQHAYGKACRQPDNSWKIVS